ncbi:hypothetical protein T4B_1527, partial [Trichinella pseudospiralis]
MFFLMPSHWMHMLLRVRIANLILEVVVDHPNQSFNRTAKIHCRWLDYVLSDAGRFLIDSNIRNLRIIYTSESVDAHAVESANRQGDIGS